MYDELYDGTKLGSEWEGFNAPINTVKALELIQTTNPEPRDKRGKNQHKQTQTHLWKKHSKNTYSKKEDTARFSHILRYQTRRWIGPILWSQSPHRAEENEDVDKYILSTEYGV